MRSGNSSPACCARNGWNRGQHAARLIEEMWSDRNTVRKWLAAAAATVLLAGCGTVAATAVAKPVTAQTSAQTRAQARARTAAVSVVPPRVRALTFARRLLGELSPPPGTRTVHLAKLPPPLNQPQAPLRPGWARIRETLEAPAEPESVWETMLARTPLRGLGGLVPGGSAGANLPAPEPSLDMAELGVTLIQLSHDTVLIVATATAIWLPVRTAAEHLDSASFRSVTISAKPWQSRAKTQTFTSQTDIALLASIINAGVPAPPAVVAAMSCAPVAIAYTLRFTPRTTAAPTVVATLGACPHAYGITVNGRQQPSFWDNGKLRTAAGALLGIRYPLGV